MNDDIQNTHLQESFHMITCISTLEHIEDTDKAIASMARLLKTGGCIVLTFPYNENRYIDNVYTLSESTVTHLPQYKTRVYSRSDITRWEQLFGLRILKQEYWQFFTGEYWTTGKQLEIPIQTSAEKKHQLSCILLQKQ